MYDFEGTLLMRRLVSGLVSLSLVLGGWPLGWLGARHPLATPQAEAATELRTRSSKL